MEWCSAQESVPEPLDNVPPVLVTDEIFVPNKSVEEWQWCEEGIER